MIKTPLQFIRLKHWPILQQLRLEEALLRLDQRNWCLINEGSTPAIVMGISGKPEQLINQEFFQKDPLPLIRRFSGGGTVVIDQNTIFVTFIFNGKCSSVQPYPEKVFQWSEALYKQLFSHIPFALKENDYICQNRKFGGNAQYLRGDRWLHHTSFLWDYSVNLMNYLTLPTKRPHYRQDRSHQDFLCRLKDFFIDQQTFENNLVTILKRQYAFNQVQIEEVSAIMDQPHRQATVELKEKNDLKKDRCGAWKSDLSTLCVKGGFAP